MNTPRWVPGSAEVSRLGGRVPTLVVASIVLTAVIVTELHGRGVSWTTSFLAVALAFATYRLINELKAAQTLYDIDDEPEGVRRDVLDRAYQMGPKLADGVPTASLVGAIPEEE
jgi:hypothetical protein